MLVRLKYLRLYIGLYKHIHFKGMFLNGINTYLKCLKSGLIFVIKGA